MSHTKLSNYRVLFDKQSEGYRASVGTLLLDGARLMLVFQYASDGKQGVAPYQSFSDDLGKTWSTPTTFGPPLTKPDLQHMAIAPVCITRRGTVICAGYF